MTEQVPYAATSVVAIVIQKIREALGYSLTSVEYALSAAMKDLPMDGESSLLSDTGIMLSRDGSRIDVYYYVGTLPVVEVEGKDGDN